MNRKKRLLRQLRLLGHLRPTNAAAKQSGSQPASRMHKANRKFIRKTFCNLNAARRPTEKVQEANTYTYCGANTRACMNARQRSYAVKEDASEEKQNYFKK